MTTAIESSIEHRRERSEKLQQVGADTPMGRFLRSYWYPVATVSDLRKWPIKKVRLLGDDFALFRADDGTVGMVADRCPHRGASLSCGMTGTSEIRCAYHGWAFDAQGKCIDTPAEPAGSKLRDRVTTPAYPVQELGGLYWTYLGAAPAPLLPRYEHLARTDLVRSVSVSDLPASWLACADNSCDPTHLEHLHMRYMNWVRKQKGLPPIAVRKHAKIAFDVFEFGIIKRRLWEGENEQAEEWAVGHPMLLPATLVIPYSATWVRYQFRVPIDAQRTMIYWYDAREPKDGETVSADVPVTENPFRDESGEFILDAVNAQDMSMWVTQGPKLDHVTEHLGDSDRGIALFRRLLDEQMDRVERGEDAMGVIRDPARNTPYVQIPIERHIGYSLAGTSPGAGVEYPHEAIATA